jgi:hypothetical protein
MARMYNRYGAADKNVRKIDLEIVSVDKDGNPIPTDLLVIRAFSKKEECYVTFAPNMADKTIGLMVDRNSDFTDRVLEHLANTGQAEKIMKEIYAMVFLNTPPTPASNEIKGTFS